MILEALPQTPSSVAAGHADIENLGIVVDDVDPWRVGDGAPTDVGETERYDQKLWIVEPVTLAAYPPA
jgi:hypothetical protein